MEKSLLPITIIFGLLHLGWAQVCVTKCKTEFADALASKQTSQPNCLGLAGYLSCVSKCGQDAVNEIQQAASEMQGLCASGAGPGAGGDPGADSSNPASVFSSPTFQKAMQECDSVRNCYASVDMTNVDFTKIKQLCDMMKPAMTCIKDSMVSCPTLSADEKSQLGAGVDQMLSVCGGGGALGLQIITSWLKSMGASDADVSKASQCQAMKDCANNNPVDISKVMETFSKGDKPDMKALCKMTIPLFTCTTGSVSQCQISDKVTKNFRGSSQMIGTVCQIIESGDGSLNNVESVARLMASQGTSDELSQPACEKWMTCLASSQPTVQDQCSQLKSASTCYETAADGCQTAQDFKPIADQAKMDYEKKCNGGTHVAPVFGTILTLLALAYAMMF